jgi:hypothetical protein
VHPRRGDLPEEAVAVLIEDDLGDRLGDLAGYTGKVTGAQRPLNARKPASPSALEERVGGLTSIDAASDQALLDRKRRGSAKPRTQRQKPPVRHSRIIAAGRCRPPARTSRRRRFRRKTRAGIQDVRGVVGGENSSIQKQEGSSGSADHESGMRATDHYSPIQAAVGTAVVLARPLDEFSE